MNHKIGIYYDIVLRYQRLTDINQKTLIALPERLKQALETYYEQVDAEGRDGVFKVSVVMYGAEREK